MVVGSCRIGSKNSRVVAVTRMNPGSRSSSTPSYDGLLALSLLLSIAGQVTVVALSSLSDSHDTSIAIMKMWEYWDWVAGGWCWV